MHENGCLFLRVVLKKTIKIVGWAFLLREFALFFYLRSSWDTPSKIGVLKECCSGGISQE